MIETGTTLAHYTVLSVLGRGGMGEVWKALDTKLGREVAIKTLPAQFAEDAERLARFEREARLLASVNHPHIAAIYGLEEFGGTRFLVLELVEGETLADRVHRGPISVEESLTLAHQIAGALEAAHDNGVVHRDLKPANIKVTPDGTVKVLDFGVGKFLDERCADLSNSPTIGVTATSEGVILGTAAYMAPEQARGRAVDKRVDAWAFGCVFFETLTGHAPFRGENVSDILASVLKSEPDWDSLPPNLHPRLRELLNRCLQKDPQQRYRDMGDVRLDIEGLLADPSDLNTTADAGMGVGSPSKLPWLASFLLALLTGAAAWYLKPTPAPPPDHVTRLFREITTGASLNLGQNFFAVSPTGDQFAYATGDGLYLCRMDEFEGRRISGTEGEETSEPFFSTDGQWVGYLSQGQLKKVRTTGGKPDFLANVTGNVFAPYWTADGWILYVQQPRIMRVAENGGPPLVLVDVEERVVGPVVLPDGDSLLFTVGSGTGRKVVLRSLATGDQTVLFQDAATAVQYVESGHLIYGSGNSVSVRAFNTETRAVGNPVPLVQSFFRFDKNTAPQFRVSQSGTLVYLPDTPRSEGGEAERSGRDSLALLDRGGNVVEALSAPMADYRHPRFSPDDNRIAVESTRDGGSNIEIYDIPTKKLNQLTFDGGTRPLWSPDAKEIAFLKDNAIWIVPADFRGTPTLVPGSEVAGNRGPSSWSSSGAVILFSSDAGIHALHRRSPAKTAEVIIPASEGKQALFPEFSPNDRWIVYTLGDPQKDPGAADLHVRPYPGPGDSRQITTGGGRFPIWRRERSEILFAAPIPKEITFQGLALLALPITTEPLPKRGNPDELFHMAATALIAGGGIVRGRPYDVSHDGQRFIVVRRSTAEAAASGGERTASAGNTVGPLRIYVVRNWIEEMKARVPAP